MLRLILLSALLYACLSAGSAHGQEKKLERFLLSNSTLSESRAPLYIAKELGLFEKYGLDAEIVNIRRAAINVASLMAGEIQMAVAAGTVAITAALSTSMRFTSTATRSPSSRGSRIPTARVRRFARSCLQRSPPSVRECC